MIIYFYCTWFVCFPGRCKCPLMSCQEVRKEKVSWWLPWRVIVQTLGPK